MIVLYNVLLFAAVVIGFPFIVPAVLLSGKRRKTTLPRLGLRSLPTAADAKPGVAERKPIWIHALSVGETLAAVPLVEAARARFPDRLILFSVSTRTGSEIAGDALKDSADALFFFPFDLPFSVKRIADRVDPGLVLIIESDIWPNFLLEMTRRDVPVVLANAKLSSKSFDLHRRFRRLTGWLFASFSRVCAQSSRDADLFKRLGVPSARIAVTGNMKFDQAIDRVPEGEVDRLRRSMDIPPSRRVLLAGSTHKGEEEVLLKAYCRLRRESGNLLLVIAPRDPRRAGPVAQVSEALGLPTVRMTELTGPATGKGHDVIVIDALGYLRQLYLLADIAFVGGSLVEEGGHNPLEPAAFAKPILFGPDMSDFREISQLLETSGGAVTVKDAEGISCQASALLKDNVKAREMGERAYRVFQSNKGAVARTLDIVEGCLLETREHGDNTP